MKYPFQKQFSRCFAIILMVFFVTKTSAQTWNMPGAKVIPAMSDSLAKRPKPAWFGESKLGIFIHWGLYSVPAFAPPQLNAGNANDTKNMDFFFRNMPYAEWYINTMKFKDSPTWAYHKKTYGENFNYYDFIPMFNEKAKKWQPEKWAKLFANIGAKYVVLTTKHHDGFQLWKSEVPYPNYPVTKYAMQSERDIVGELNAAVRKEGLKFGTYYSGGLDFTFFKVPINNIFPNIFTSCPQTPAYASYADAHYHELIERFKPDLLWNDITYPASGDLVGVLADYYNTVPTGIINNRWGSKFAAIKGYDTPEYKVLSKASEQPWESCRGIGNSFGINQQETDVNYISSDKLIDLFVDIVSKNGNLLLNVGPDAEGNIPEKQLSRLNDLGAWMKINGEAIYSTIPFTVAEGTSDQDIRIRFTQKGSNVYMFLLDKPNDKSFTVNNLDTLKISKIELLGTKNIDLVWKKTDTKITIEMPKDYPASSAYTLRILKE